MSVELSKRPNEKIKSLGLLQILKQFWKLGVTCCSVLCVDYFPHQARTLDKLLQSHTASKLVFIILLSTDQRPIILLLMVWLWMLKVIDGIRQLATWEDFAIILNLNTSTIILEYFNVGAHVCWKLHLSFFTIGGFRVTFVFNEWWK